MYRGLTCALLVAALWGLLVSCSDAVVEPIRRAAASTLVDAGRSELDSGHDWDRDADGDSDERDSGLDVEHCAAALSWPVAFADAERELLDRINELRSDRVRCGDDRSISDLSPLRFSPELQCSARLHSLDMAQAGFVDQVNAAGEDPEDRMRAAGFDVRESSEAIVVDETDASAALAQLLDEWDSCLDVASDELDEIGIGRHEALWTLDFARD